MGGEKGGAKSGGFFNLFDWNKKKSRKKLFSTGSVSPESTKQERRSADNLSASRLRLVDDDEFVGVSSGKGSTDYSCASSVTDEEGTAHRAPGVVARLMGLDSMPTSGVSDPISTPFFDVRSLHERQGHKRSPEFCINDQFSHIAYRAEGCGRRPMEARTQKMPSSPIERFQTETLPPRSAKSLPMSHHKLLSPIKNPGFISAKNAAHIMEAAAKILDPGNQPSIRAKVSSFVPSSIPLRVRESKESIAVTQSHRTSRIFQSTRNTVDLTDVRHLREQPLSKSWNGVEDNAASRCYPNSSDANPSDVKGKGKSVSLAIQAKVNVQRRESMSSSSRNTMLQKEHDGCRLNQPFKSQSNNQKNKQQMKSVTTNGSGALRQNNQKQNCMSSKGKLSSKQSLSNQHGRKVLTGDASSTKNKTLNKFPVNSRIGNRKEGAESTDFEREGQSSSNKDFPRKKRMIEGGFISEKNGSIDNVLVRRLEKRVQPNVVIDEHSCSRWKEVDKSDGSDVVSFTFTSPLVKSVPGSRFSTPVVENLDKGNMYCFDTHSQKNNEEKNDKKLLSHGLNVISGDALSVLLEQKLRELTSGVEPSYDNILKPGSCMESSPILEKPLFDSGAATEGHVKELQQVQHRDKPGGVFGYGVSSCSDQVCGASKLQDSEDFISSNDARKEHQHQSPFSILEASFSNESCYSTESSGSTDETKACSSIPAQNNARSSIHEAEMELSDSASSTITEIETLDASELSRASRTNSSEQDLDYVSEVLFNTASTSNDDSGLYPLVLAGDNLNPLLFNKLEDERRGEYKDVGRLRRKVLFDCVNECMDLKSKRYFEAGYRAWCKGAAFVRKENLVKEVYDEISGWKSMGDWMVDEIVDKDMSSHLGRWVEYEIEAFEVGSEIESEILSSLVDEVVADCLMRTLQPVCVYLAQK